MFPSFKVFVFDMYQCSECTYVSTLHVHLVPMKFRNGHWIFWNWS